MGKDMENIHQEFCQVCGSKRIPKFLETRDYFYSQEEFDLLKCEDCGFVFTQNVLNEKEIGKYYKSQDYISHSDTKKGLINKLYHISRNYMLGRKAKIIKKYCLSGCSRLLDIGSGTGYFLNFMKEQKWGVTGVEQDLEARKFSQNNFNLEVISQDEMKDLKPDQFDIITMWHVLEHVQPLNEYLERIHKLLKKDGRFFVAVPNYISFDAKHYGEYWAAYDVPRHLWHFSPGSFIKLMEKHNFKVLKTNSMPLDSFYISVVSEGYKHNKFAIVSGFIIGFVSFLLSTVNKKRSSSVLYIIEKQSD